LFYPLPTGIVAENLYCICDREDVNFFVYSDGNNTICIDAGYINNNYVKQEFEEIGIDPASIDALFLTHTDMDHAGALDIDSNSDWLTNARIYMSEQEEDLITKRQRRRFLFYTPIEISKEYTFVSDEEVIRIGDIRITAIHTPGHTSGHMSYLVDDRILFSGDVLLLKDDKVEPFYRIWNMDHELVKESIRRLASLQDIEILCTAHSKCSFEFEKVMNNWIN
jgi:glyoxylase-like metal-dependent hydrolase (beta-lactamase superfamily II)